MRNVTLKSVCIVLIIITLFSAFATGCDLIGKDNTGDTDKNQPSGLESGFRFQEETCLPKQNNLYCGYKSEKSEFNINEVTFNFYYGLEYVNESLGIEYELEKHSYPSFDIYFADDYGKKILVKHVDENLISEKYRCEVVRDKDYYITDITFNHSEALTIPKEIFTKNSDIVRFAIYGTDVTKSLQEYKCIATANIFYKVTGEKVILSATPFE